MIAVGFADDHAEMRVSLRLLLRLFREIEIAWEATNGQEALDFMQHIQTDVVVLDIQMPKLGGLEVTKQIAERGLHQPIILISLNRGNFMMMEAIQAGAKGFIPKEDLASLLLPAIQAVHNGQTYFVEQIFLLISQHP